MVTLILAKHGHARQPSSPSGHRKSYQRLGIGCADCGIPPDTNGNLARNHAPRDLPAARGGRDENGQNTVNARTPLRPRMRRDVGNPLPRSGRGRGGREAPKISRILCLMRTPHWQRRALLHSRCKYAISAPEMEAPRRRPGPPELRQALSATHTRKPRMPDAPEHMGNPPRGTRP